MRENSLPDSQINIRVVAKLGEMRGNHFRGNNALKTVNLL